MNEKELNNTTPDNISYDLYENSVQYRIPKSLDVARQQYHEIPIVKEFVDREIQAKFVATHHHTRKVISAYEVAGFLLKEAGKEFNIDLGDYGVPNERPILGGEGE